MRRTRRLPRNFCPRRAQTLSSPSSSWSPIACWSGCCTPCPTWTASSWSQGSSTHRQPLNPCTAGFRPRMRMRTRPRPAMAALRWKTRTSPSSPWCSQGRRICGTSRWSTTLWRRLRCGVSGSVSEPQSKPWTDTSARRWTARSCWLSPALRRPCRTAWCCSACSWPRTGTLAWTSCGRPRWWGGPRASASSGGSGPSAGCSKGPLRRLCRTPAQAGLTSSEGW
mmetsp:Transcript_24913/g.69774  ORF Transcript_24913/g.69774 Transcript_24913/m.69774 type:complete len:224 (-) Transcript_24913:1772-2443(-)